MQGLDDEKSEYRVENTAVEVANRFWAKNFPKVTLTLEPNNVEFTKATGAISVGKSGAEKMPHKMRRINLVHGV